MFILSGFHRTPYCKHYETAPKRIRISGGGIAGPVLGFLLRRLNWHVTIVERAPKLRATGQQIDITGSGLTIIRRMGLDAPIRKEIVYTDGLNFVDSSNKVWASFAQKDTGDSFVEEYEILRSDLAGIFYEHTKDDLDGSWEAMSLGLRRVRRMLR
jgi:2-polyprenyl-6-methoxyphenol hydroxylase-like FAD-dependent oxidoreductase